MGLITLRQAADWCGGWVDPKYENITFLGASNDSRNIQPGQLFVALKAERDGHDFIPAALGNGASAVLCTRTVGDHPAIVVEDTRLALGQIARGERCRIGMTVVGVTGSVGKSTTKEMICDVLATQYRVGKTPANHNNDIGMPMAILSMEPDTQVAVLEMGMNHFREIAYLADIAQPDVAVITNIGTMHIEHLGSQQGILQAKLEIIEGMKEGGRLVLNGDDALLWNQRNRHSIPLVYYGTQNPECRNLSTELYQEPSLLRFNARCGDETFAVVLPLEGMHYVSDAMAAVSVGLEMGISTENICAALASFRNMEGRQEIFEAKGYTVIKDCYNAGPESMAAALAVLGGRKGRKVAVLGDMLELGSSAPAEHYRIGRIAAENADVVLAYGPNSSRLISGALTGGMPPANARAFEDRDTMVAAMKHMLKEGDVVLVKGSRGMRMELILDKFLAEET